MAKLIKFILPLLVFLLSGYNSFSKQETICHSSTEIVSLDASSFQTDRLVKVGAFQKKGLGHEDYLIEVEEEEEEVIYFENNFESGNFITALFCVSSYTFPVGSVYNGTPVCESLSSNKRYVLFGVFEI
ncbi:hypothetical protein [Arcticibacterium luteifluviistationis]|uniref:Uncharacterized protein n=1 Tax=Arcticibacterium luteifluviistationis TaxID=1784714 RepID=A0A2Z4G7J3_9BACT|nr:hypothetical protein [Arcticibacterium luteifluviistationis]AWV97166.1 hypothetical protein DJ013_02840 [Arcticibacterium luteifluviistationis]